MEITKTNQILVIMDAKSQRKFLLKYLKNHYTITNYNLLIIRFRAREANQNKPNKMAEAASKIKETREHAYSILEHSIKQLSKLFKAFEVPELIKSRFKKYDYTKKI